MPNIFRAQQKHAGAFQASDMVMRINGNRLAGHVVQQVNMQYQQQISTLYEIGSSNVYYVGGRAQGNLTIARVAGPEALPGILLTEFNDICNPGQLTLSAASSQCNVGGQFNNGANATGNYKLEGVLVISLGLSTQAQDVVVNEQMGFQFIDLSLV